MKFRDQRRLERARASYTAAQTQLGLIQAEANGQGDHLVAAAVNDIRRITKGVLELLEAVLADDLEQWVRVADEAVRSARTPPPAPRIIRPPGVSDA